ncbi:MAG: hypothetical protein AAF514_19405, partial [Verrucomicrobiota bacterium]
ATGDPHFVSASEREAILSTKEKEKLAGARNEIQRWEKSLTDLEKKQGSGSPWTDVAHAVFNLKEFIYLY